MVHRRRLAGLGTRLMAGLESDHPGEQDEDEEWDLQDDIDVAE